jgi:hypothetical protein
MKHATPQTLHAAMVANAQREIVEQAPRAATFTVMGNDPGGTGDLIIVGQTPMGLTTVAIRLTIPQALALSANLTGALSVMMEAAQRETLKLAKKQGGDT